MVGTCRKLGHAGSHLRVWLGVGTCGKSPASMVGTRGKSPASMARVLGAGTW
ncbi:hypothetical protein Dimus_027484, partial [Dionaea muscipula]